MKKITIDCDECRKILNENSNYIEIGSMDEKTFFYENSIQSKKIGTKRTIYNHYNLHFCSNECFVNYFFGI